MEDYSVYLPQYSVGRHIYDKIYEVCRPYGQKAVAIGGSKGIGASGELIRQVVCHTDLKVMKFIPYGKEASYEAVMELSARKEVQEADMIFAIGGGKALDTCKALGEKIDKPVFTFPTIASTCAATTAVAIMYYPDGRFKEPFFLKKPPIHAFLHTEILAHAPSRYLWAGMGDTYAKYYEASISSRNETLSHYLSLGVTISQMCVAPILQYGEQALNDNKEGNSSPQLEQILLAVIVTTGIASNLLTKERTPDYNSGLAHGVCYGLTVFPQVEKNHLHGEIVAYGMLITLLCDGQREEYKKLRNFHEKVGLPVKLQDLEISKEEIRSIFIDIKSASDVKHYPYQITDQMLEEAVEFMESERMI